MGGDDRAGRLAWFPAENNEFVGRTAELRHIDELLRRTRLVTLTGPGGVGKTRTALRAAAAAAPRYPDGVCLVELSALRDPALLPHTVARRLELSEHAPDSQRAALLAHLHNRSMLLILDTCEHLIDACAELAEDILRQTPAVTVLAASREPLDVDGETTFPVRPLPVTGAARNGEDPHPFGLTDSARGGHGSGTQTSAGGDAVELFARRAAAAVPGFAVTEANRAEVIGLCQRLDGMPLAIELAAVRLRTLPLAELTAGLGPRLPLLTGADTENEAANDDRHRTLRDAIGWSYELCTEAERRLWARLSVFAGAFSVAAARQVCAGPGLDADDIFQTIIRLVDKSVLVRAEPPAAGGGDDGQTAWYRMLDTIREFGEDVLRASGEQAAVRDLLIARYVDMARSFAAHLTDADQLERFRELRREHNQLRAALRHTLDGEPAQWHRQGAELAIALSGYWAMSGLLREGRYWLAKVLDLFPGPSRVRGWALACRCYLGAMQGAADEAVADGTAGTEIGVALGDKMLVGRGYAFLTLALAIAARYEEANAAAEQAERTLDLLGDHIGLGTLDAHRAHLSYLAGDPAATLRYAARGLGRLDGTREWWSSGWLHAISAMALYLLPGRDAETARAATRSLLAKHELGDMVGMAYCLEIHGWLAARAGRQARAAWLLGAADPLWTRAGGRLGGTRVLERLHTEAIAAARAGLRPAKFNALFAGGGAAPLGETVAFAVADLDAPGRRVPAVPQPHKLTDREWEIAYLAGAGLSAEQISGQTFLSTPVVEHHLASAFGKLGVSAADQLEPWLEERATRLKVAAALLLALDRLEEGLEVALAEAERAVPLDELEEDGRPVADRLGEDLQQVAVLVAVDQDAALAQFLDGNPDLADPLPQHRVGVVRVRRDEELDAAGAQRVHASADVGRGERQVLHARAAVELQVLVDLRLLLADGGLVQRELHPVVPARHHLAHQRGVLGGDVLADELGQVGEAHHPVVEGHPFVHGAELDVADDVVERDERGRLVDGAASCHVPRKVGAVVAGAVHQRVRGVTVGLDGRRAHRAVLVVDVVRLRHDRGARRARVRDALVHVGHLERHVEHAVAVPAVVVGDRAVRADRALDDEPDLPRRQHVRVMVAVPGLRPGVRLQPHAEGQLEVRRRLRRVPRRPDDRVPAGDRERVVADVMGDHARQAVGVEEIWAGCHRCASGASARGSRSSAIRTGASVASQPLHILLVVLSILRSLCDNYLVRLTR
jgi:non-specific serine/threonine protein kinase